MAAIKNIIFDLGGVIINLDTPATIAAFNRLSAVAFESIYTQAQQTRLFDQFDKGQVTEADFFTGLRTLLKTNVPTDTLKAAWNAMLLDFPEHRIYMLGTLKSKYRLFLLSNTNETHVAAFEKILHQSHSYNNLEPLFEKVYYSCRVGMRKPDAEIFQYVLLQNQLNPAETIFVDDTQQHVNGAKACGIEAVLLPKEKDVTALVKELSLS